MRFAAVPLDRAEGAILAHSVDLPKGRLRKGRWLDGDDIAHLRDAGIETVTVAQLDDTDVHEDTAAARLAAALIEGGRALRVSKAATGRVNLYAKAGGVVQIDTGAIDAINRLDPAITVATLPPFHWADEGMMIATIKIIPYAVEGGALARAEALAGGALSLATTALRKAAFIETTGGKDLGEKGARAIADRLTALGVAMAQPVRVPHDEAPLAEAIGNAQGDVILILTATATSDAADVAPAALRRAGGRVHHYGMPVDPGNLLFLGDLAGRPVIGLPGCVRSPALNGADWVLQRVVCGLSVTGDDIMGMGVGGLLKEIPTRPRPREG
ncbi:molybdopterin-binding protein [Oceaniglobus trochenteri]|uniref:molybdopterin-binding protein n=1 Tax=Oceaniglobus trochenteri TaxID=2763260 RepID=UPI001CFFBCF4|nr:molybdopterin-binding protein [Oceaniglobus trochenteri]